MIKEVLYVVIVLAGIPFGIFLDKLCKDESGNWNQRFKIISAISLVLIFLVWLLKFEYRIPVTVGLSFVILTSRTIALKNKRGKTFWRR